MTDDLKLIMRDRVRARDTIAEVICACEMTDGSSHPRTKPDCRCHRIAASCLLSMDGRGLEIIWKHSPERRALAERGEN